jgi:uncharacterized 2Fe-2S/4Fe-4S cluster protein (DUF4445 family)
MGGNRAITITQKDVRALQLAKGAIAAGVQVLLKASGRQEQEIDKVIIGGAFGSYLDINSAVAVGMLPDLASDKFIQVGNSAGMGARLALVSRAKREEAKKIGKEVNYIELAAFPGFAQIFAQCTFLGHDSILEGETYGN